MKLSVAPESTKTCLSVVKCEDFKRVGIHSDLYLLANTIFDSTFSRHAQANRVASFKNPAQKPTSIQVWAAMALFMMVIFSSSVRA